MNEHRAAASCNARPGVVVDLHDHVVEMILAREPVAALVRLALDRAVVAVVMRIFRPGVVRSRPSGRSDECGLALAADIVG